MEFWKWFLKEGVKGLRTVVLAIVSPWGEHITALVIGAFALPLISMLVGPYWLFLIIPVFTVFAAHGYWRVTVREKEYQDN